MQILNRNFIKNDFERMVMLANSNQNSEPKTHGAHLDYWGLNHGKEPIANGNYR